MKKEINLESEAKKIADRIHALGGSDFLMNQIFDHYYGRVVGKAKKDFDELYAWLKKNKHTSEKSALWYGDQDAQIWVEESKTERIKAIIMIWHCEGRDDRVYLFMKRELFEHFELHARRIWEAEEKGKNGVEKPSIETYRNKNFRHGYFDCRDNGYLFSYRSLLGETEGGAHYAGAIAYGVRQLVTVNEMKESHGT